MAGEWEAAGAEVATKESVNGLLHMEVEKLDKAVAFVEQRVDDLAARLLPVLHPSEPSEVGSQLDVVKSARAPLTLTLGDLFDRVDVVGRRLQVLSNRLEV